MARRRYDIVLHMFDEQDTLPRVDPRYYTYQKLLDDIGRCRMIPEGVKDAIVFYIYADCEDRNERIQVVCDEDVIEMFHRNVLTYEVHVWIHTELITPLGVELHVIDLDAEEDGHAEGGEGVQAEGAADEDGHIDGLETSVEDVDETENETQDECDSVRGARQTDDDEVDRLMSDYLSGDAPLDAVSEIDGSEDEVESEDPMKHYLHRNMYEGAEGSNQAR
ncbi:hypothetical protein Salat_0097300 [Sesamum alatum]|uniref:Uncharacterized protein n=1 Tax=Sesamum alatum TaxID=300844 RepID=A0AAE1YX60_9LAMI|nr:hypothetical protein Salat_0097300 [Sesamum alatum]